MVTTINTGRLSYVSDFAVNKIDINFDTIQKLHINKKIEIMHARVFGVFLSHLIRFYIFFLSYAQVCRNYFVSFT